MKSIYYTFLLLSLFFYSCNSANVEPINNGEDAIVLMNAKINGTTWEILESDSNLVSRNQLINFQRVKPSVGLPTHILKITGSSVELGKDNNTVSLWLYDEEAISVGEYTIEQGMEETAHYARAFYTNLADVYDTSLNDSALNLRGKVNITEFSSTALRGSFNFTSYRQLPDGTFQEVELSEGSFYVPID